MAVIVKAAGVPWFNILNQGLEAAGKQFNITTSMVGPAQIDPAQLVKLIDDLIAKKVDVIGLVPLDVTVTGQAVKRAREMGEEGEYVVYVGTLTTPGHNQWADAAIAY